MSTTTVSPPATAPRPPLADVPMALKLRPQWVLWKREARKPGGPTTKVPYAVRGSKASSTNPATWATFGAVYEAWQRAPQTYAGIGYVFTADDPFTGVDLDKSLDDAGQLLPWARELFNPANTYGEVSPSGTGVKFIVQAELPGDGVNVKGFGPDGTGGVELYDRGRFFTITGQKYHECVGDIDTGAEPGVLKLYRHVKPKPAPKPVASGKPRGNGDDGNRVNRCLAYLEKVPDAISGSGGHNATFRAAAECVRFGLDDSEAWDVLLWFNANKTAGESWTEKELRHKLDSARRKAGDEAGHRLNENRSGKSREDRNGYAANGSSSGTPKFPTIKPGQVAELPADGTVYVCPAFNAPDLIRAGLNAVDAAPDPAKTDWSELAGRDVVVLLCDGDDETGFADVTMDLARLNPAPTLRIVRLPNVATVAEFIATIGDERASDAGEMIAAMADAVEPTQAEDLIGGPVLIDLSTVTPREVQWLWPGRIPLGRMSLLVGMQGGGKSFLTCDAAARVTHGGVWPDGSPCPQGSVLFICAEDDPADTICPRLIAAGADMTKVKMLESVKRRNRETGKMDEMMFTLADVLALRTALAKMPDCRLIVVDPIGSFLGGGVDAHRDNEVRGVLAPMSQLARDSGAALVLIAHRRKSASVFADDTALGSRAFTALARAVWHLLCDPNDKRRRLLLPGKNNLAEEGDGLAFSIIGKPPVLAWEAEPVAMTADDGMAEEAKVAGGEKDDDGQTKLEQAQHFVADALRPGPRAWDHVALAGKQAGHSSRTLERARTRVAETFKVSAGWFWRNKGDTSTEPIGPEVRQAPKRNGEVGEVGEVQQAAAGSALFSQDLEQKPNLAKTSTAVGEVEPIRPRKHRPSKRKIPPFCGGEPTERSTEDHA